MQIKKNYKTILDILKKEIEGGKYAFESLLPTENELAEKYCVSRPTITKVYNALQDKNYLTKKKGVGTRVIYQDIASESFKFGLLLPGAGESEIFSVISNRFLKRSQEGMFSCLWEGATTGSAELRKGITEKCSMEYIEQKVDGVFFAPLERIPHTNEINNDICKRFTKAGIPLILIDRDIVEFPNRSLYDLVSLDNFAAGYTMAEHLLNAGCTVINFVYRPNSAFSVTLRHLGVAAAIRKKQMDFGNENLYCGDPEDQSFVENINIIPKQTGFICANDSTAAVLMSTMNAMGIGIATDVLISGYDDMKYADYLKYPLTSYSQPCEDITDVAIELMMRRVKNKNAIPLSVNLLGKIVARGSTIFLKK